MQLFNWAFTSYFFFFHHFIRIVHEALMWKQGEKASNSSKTVCFLQIRGGKMELSNLFHKHTHLQKYCSLER